ncbi:hypothetical protein DIURU_000646 [Diutina rugosa]|uniref:Crh-like protein n=1 Tax=Diutina rugosa TaxID=5481 RepID=A0A642V337_DIURU|nr:uncharacterized protein DIURU_000646 [Diutina rugosa]KAA8906962.1 hypothetical protein DIURU_000646 [Diutina rugosa]
MKLALMTLAAALTSMVSAADQIKCSESSPCPEDQPCCSQFGVCGTGAYCLGGCNPMWSYNISACMPQPVMSSFKTEFTDIGQVKNQYTYLGNSSEIDWLISGNATIDDGALQIQMPANSVGAVVSSTKYFWYGNVKVNMKTSRGAGVVSAFIVFSDVQDEIDFEMVGSDLTGPQSNYYYHAELDYKNAKRADVSDTFENYHEYQIDWQENEINWYIDGNLVRTLKKEDTLKEDGKYHFPQTPSRVQFSLWPGGDASQGQGTIEWAGGPIDWNSQDIQDKGYYYAYVKDVDVQCNDLPSDLKRVGSGSGDYNAFIYTDKAGTSNDVALTNAKTWIGQWNSTGLNPENEEKSSSSSSSSSSSKSKSSSSSSSSASASSSSASESSSSKSDDKSSSSKDDKSSTKSDDKSSSKSDDKSSSKTDDNKSSQSKTEDSKTSATVNVPQGNRPGAGGSQVSQTAGNQGSGNNNQGGSGSEATTTRASGGGFNQGNNPGSSSASASGKASADARTSNQAAATSNGFLAVVGAVLMGALSVVM